MLYMAHIFDHELYGWEEWIPRDPIGAPTDLQDE